MNATETAAPRTTPLWMRVALVVSLGLNLLVAGVVLGAVLTRDREGGPADRMRTARDLGPPAFVLALEPDDRRALVDDFREASERFRPDRAALRERLGALLAELRTEPFDAEAVTGLLADERARATGRQEIGARLLVDYLAGLSPDGRRAYADRLERALRRGVRR